MTKCFLCEQDEDLRESHIISRFVYRFMQKTVGDGNEIVQFDSQKNLLQLSNRQLKKRLFCGKCEQLLGKNETDFSTIFHDINSQKPNERQYYGNPEKLILKIQNDATLKGKYTREQISKEITLFLKSSPFYNKDDIVKYFAISYIFRELLRNDYEIPDFYIQKMRKYLLNIEYFDFIIDIRLNNHPNSFNLFTSVIVFDTHENWKHFVFCLPNMLFHIAFSVKCEISNKFKELMIIPDNLFNFNDETKILSLIRDFQKDAKIAQNAQAILGKN